MHPKALSRSWPAILGLLALAAGVLSPLLREAPAFASHTPDPANVTIAGSLQSELGCGGDWDPGCALTNLSYDPTDDVWQGVFTVPAGNWEYKAALNGSWDENYGANAQQNGPNIPLNLASATAAKFYYDHKSHWITDNHNSRIATAPGSYQSEIGCPGDWQPDCLRSWLQDTDGDGFYSFSTTAIPPGSYEFKVAINESWGENYGAGGVRDGANIPFTVPGAGYIVTFGFDSPANLPSVSVVSTGPRPDNDVWWDGLRHDSRDLLYRTPGGAVPAGTPVKLRLRTYHNDITGVRVRVYDLNTNAQQLVPMTIAASDVDCYQELPFSCDFWETTLEYSAPTNLWYRFIVSDGSDMDFYADNTPALDGGLGSTSDNPIDNSYALMFYDPAFTAPAWAKEAFIYQIFPDRFRNGRANNDAHTGDVRYDDPVLALPWATLPEGYCRNYADGTTNCPWRFDDTPPDWSPTKEGPRGRDYFGGDLKGVDQYLDYLQSLGVTAIYFNPIFDAGSNHSYDTQDYYAIDPYFGAQKDWENLVKHANQRGMRIVLDGVFNHLSSDSPFFDRYHHYATVGACESADSPYRDWFNFRAPAGNEPSPCAPSTPGGSDTYYDGWFGFDSIPVINKTLPEVQEYFLTGTNSVSRYWLNQGASAWRMDVSGDPSFPAGYWETFRQITKSTRPDALLISETWQKDSTLLRMLRGDRLDTTMNYRLRDAVIGLLTPGPFDSKGFADSGRQITPTEFANRIASIREDYPDAAFYALMNLLDSHDTERLLWALTPGVEMRASKEFDAANLAEGKRRLQIASLIQFAMPGAPTVFYGDEVGLTGDDDPDDRRTYPWADKGGSPDNALFAHYQALASLRRQNEALTSGDLRMLLADDAAQVIAFGRKTTSQAAVIIVNRGDQAQTGAIPVEGYLPDGVVLNTAYAVGEGGMGSAMVVDGQLTGTIGPKSAVILLTGLIDLLPPDAPAHLVVTGEGDGSVGLAWDGVPETASYNVYRSPLSGGGWVKANAAPLNETSFTDMGLRNARTYYYVVTSLDEVGNESGTSNQVSGMPHYMIGWANLQWPPSMNHTISTIVRTDNAYGQVWIDGVTSQPGATEGLIAQLGFGPEGSSPEANPDWTWVEASFNVDVGNNDEFVASLLPEAIGVFDYLYRYSTTNGREWLHADLNGPVPAGSLPPNPGKLTVNSSGDLTPPAIPEGLRVLSASPDGIALAWDPVMGDASLYGYEVRRSDTPGGSYTTLALVVGAEEYVDANVDQGATYYYVVRSVDTSFNRSGHSAEVQATAELRSVSVTFNLTVPAHTPAERVVFIAGTLNRLDGGLPEWDPGGVTLTQVDATHWTITLSGAETTQIEYKYTLGSWDFVEKGAACDELSNRQLILSYGSDGNQVVNDTVLNWRNIAPCGN